MLTDSQIELANKLIDIGAVKFGKFKLKMHDNHPDRPLSPIYLNLRTAQHSVPEKRGPLDDEAMNMIGFEFAILLDAIKWDFDLFADIPEAGTPFGDQIASMLPWRPDEMRLQLVKTTRPDNSRYISGLRGGNWKPGRKVLLVDDLVSGADTKLEAVQILQGVGLVVWHIVVLIDRCQGGVQQLNNAGLDISAAMTLPDMLAYYASIGSISDDFEKEANAYLALASTW